MMHTTIVTHLGPSPLYLPPLCPSSSQSTPMIYRTLPWLSCTRCMFIRVVQCTAACSSRTVHTWSRVHWVWIHLAQVDCLPLQHRQHHHLPRTDESTGSTFVSLQNGTSNLILTLHCTTDMHVLFPSLLPCLMLPHRQVIWSVWTTWTGQLVTLLWPTMLLLPFTLLLHTVLPLLSST